MRRKTLKNNLAACGIDKSKLDSLGQVVLNMRPEQFDLGQFVDIYLKIVD